MSISHNKFSAGVDIGGTFTDLALIGRDGGRLAIGKVLTDDGDVSRSVMSGLRTILAESGVSPGDVEEAESTVVIGAGAQARADEHNNLHLTLPAA